MLKKLGNGQLYIPYLQFPCTTVSNGVARKHTIRFDVANFSTLSFHLYSTEQDGSATTSSFVIKGITDTGETNTVLQAGTGAADRDYTDLDISEYTTLEFSAYLYEKYVLITNVVCE